MRDRYISAMLSLAWVSWAALYLLVAADGARAAAVPAALIHVGPVYTRGNETGSYPKFPDLQIQVDVPPAVGSDLLKPEAFQLRVDGGSPVIASREQTLASSGYGIAAVVSIDVSGSMKGAPLNAIRTGLSKFVNDAGPQDKIAIQTIADDGRWEANWDDSPDQDRAALQKLAARGSLTRLWDAVLEAIHRFPDTPLSRHLIVISDGHDEGSVHKEQEVVTAAIERGILLDAIGMTRSNPEYLKTLQSLTVQTSGQFREARNSDELERLLSSGIERLKLTPVVSFRTDDLSADGKARRFEVTWKHEGVESKAEVTATIPLVKSWSGRVLWLWVGGAAAFLLLLLSTVLIGARNRGAGARNIPAATVPEPKPIPAPQSFAPPLPATSLHQPTSAEVRSNFAPLRSGKAQGPVPVPVKQPVWPIRSKTEINARFVAPIEGQPVAWLLCEEGFATGRKFPLDKVEFWIGALDNNHLQISDDPTVSGNHACLVFDHDMLGIYDHDSTNGTRVNGEVVREKRRLLRPGDRIGIGRSTFAVYLGAWERTGS